MPQAATLSMKKKTLAQVFSCEIRETPFIIKHLRTTASEHYYQIECYLKSDFHLPKKMFYFHQLKPFKNYDFFYFAIKADVILKLFKLLS